MNNNKPENRLKDLELELRDLEGQEISASLQKEMSFRKAIENAIPSGIAVIDDTGKQIYVNQSFCKITGWDEDELLGQRPPYVYWAKHDMENINNALEKTLGNNTPKNGFDLIFKHKSGRSINVNIVISPFVQEDKKTFWLANVIDITERKKEEADLIKSQLLLKSSIESQKDTIIFSIGKNYEYLIFNKAHADAMKFAYNTDIEIGRDMLVCISSDVDRKRLKANFDRALNGESHSITQTFGTSNLGDYEVFYNPIFNDNNEIIGCTGLARNITDRLKMELALKESETKFKEIIDQINDGIIVFDEKGKIFIWNQGIEEISGLKARETINKNIVDIRYQFTPPEIRDRTQIENTINGIVTLQTPEAFNKIVDNEIISLNSSEIRNVQSNVFPIRLDGYNLFGAVLRDTTEIKRYEKELQRTIEEKDKFYSTIAQYLYTPFSLFNNFSKLMAEELDTLPIKELQKMAVMMSKSATNLYSLLDNLLQWTRMNQGKITFRPQKLNFIKVSQTAVSILKPIADAKNITIKHFVEDDISVFADIYMLKTILRNLVSNAIKYTNSDGHIDISAQQTTSNVVISILDTGSGIKPEYLEKMFNGSQFHTTLGESEEKGTTLGLFLCKEFVEKHGGKIWVESANGQGSKFNFTVPLYIEQEYDKSN